MLHLSLCRDGVGWEPLLHVLTVLLGVRMHQCTACVLVIHRTLFREKVKMITENLCILVYKLKELNQRQLLFLISDGSKLALQSVRHPLLISVT